MANRTRSLLMVAALVSHVVPVVASAQGPYVYPQRGESPEQQQRDRGDCHVWATQQSGFDPARQAVAVLDDQGSFVISGACTPQ